MQRFGGKSREEYITWKLEDLGVNVRVIVEWIQKDRLEECGLE
jgi:hypothetical protein